VERIMATDTNTGGGGTGSNTFLSFVLGGLIVVVVLLGLFVFSGGHMFGASSPGNGTSINLNVKAPSAPKPGG
jgi:hypothetical protein